MTIADFSLLEKIHEGSQSIVYRACYKQDQTPVVVKVLRSTDATPEAIARFRQEYDLTQQMAGEGIVQCLDFYGRGNDAFMVLEDFGGSSLERILAQTPLPLLETIDLAIQITTALGQVHSKRIIHKDINPSNLVYNPQTQQVKIIDFGIASSLTATHAANTSAIALEGTLPYLAPEQTGRMNRSIDYRSDFYALGATLYELLVGRPPFLADDPLEMIHAHMAQMPAPLTQLRPDIPEVLSKIVLKLLAKIPEQRYQSAYGLKHDLQRCLTALQTTGSIELFELGQADFAESLRLPQKLYGRETELATLIHSFGRVRQGHRESILVAGYSGIGKTALINELRQHITQNGGCLIAGKFDQFRRGIPYSAWIEAIGQRLRQILNQSDEWLAQWQAHLSVAVGDYGQLLTDVVPELALILGAQPPLETLPPNEFEARFSSLVRRVVRTLASADCPLVIFLDDLQWADLPSIALLKRLQTDLDSAYILLLGTYRSNEVDRTHPLQQMLDEMAKLGEAPPILELDSLQLQDICHLLSDCLRCELEAVTPLAALCQEKTQGNPFFLRQFIESLYEAHLLQLDVSTGKWFWQLEEIRDRNLTDDVAIFMVQRLATLTANAQSLLSLAAFLGNRFEVDSLASLSQLETVEVQSYLNEAIASGFIVPIEVSSNASSISAHSDNNPIAFGFVHDRVQQAAYSLQSDETAQQVHLQIARMLVAPDRTSEQLDESIFDIVNHYRQALDQVTDPVERQAIAQYALTAGIRAKQSAAFQPALNFLQSGIVALPKDAWETQYDFTLSLYRESAEAAYLATDFDRMDELIAVVLSKARNLIDKVLVHEMKINALVGFKRMTEAIAYATDILVLLDIRLPKQINQFHALWGVLTTKAILQGKTTECLVNSPTATDAKGLATLRILISILSAAYYAEPLLMPLLMFHLIRTTIKHGIGPESSYIFSVWGLVLCSLEEINNGYLFGSMAQHLNQRIQIRRLKDRSLHVFNYHIRFWKEHYRVCQKELQQLYVREMEGGDLEFASYSAHAYCCISYYLGDELQALAQTMTTFSQLLRRLGHEPSLHTHEIHRQLVFNLAGLVDNPDEMCGEVFNESVMIPRLQQEEDVSNLFVFYSKKAILKTILGDYAGAIAAAAENQKYLQGAKTTIYIPYHYWIDGLAHAALYNSQPKSAQKQIHQRLKRYRKKIKIWADLGPMNHLHHLHLLDAEIAQIEEHDRAAMQLYDQAIQAAHEQGYLNDEALAQEFAARYYLNRGNHRIASAYMLDARNTYARWGAKVKVERLEVTYGELLSIAGTSAIALFESSSSSSKTESNASVKLARTTFRAGASQLDAVALIKALQAISSEIMLPQLIQKLMQITIEASGAGRSLIILWEGEKLVIQDECLVGQTTPSQPMPIAVDDYEACPKTMLQYVARTQSEVLLEDATQVGTFTQDPYIHSFQPKSILCIPLLHQGKSSGMIYLENNLTTGVFTTDRLEVLKLLSSQAAISIENAKLYTEMTELNTQLTQEVSDRKQAEEAVRQSEQTLAQFLEAVPVGVGVLDRWGKPYYVNQRAQEILGKGVAPDATSEQIAETYQLYLAGTHQVYDSEKLPIVQALRGKRITADDVEVHQPNRIIPLEAWGAPIFDEHGSIVYAMAAFQDITQRKQAEDERLQFMQTLSRKNVDLQQAQAELAEINRTLEQKVEQRTLELSQTLEILKATQAELRFENELLRSADTPLTFDYQVGGSLPMDAPTYVVRSADRHLYRGLRQGQFCYVLNARQMGKSSLMVRMLQQLQQEGYSCAAVDMSRVGSEMVTPDQWYKGLAVELWQAFDLMGKVNLKTWWSDRLDLSPVQRLSQFIENILLVEVGNEAQPLSNKLVIFLDEIDSLLGLNFSINDFFALIRSCYNQRSLNPAYQRLTFAFFGVAAPSDLITDIQRTPFNIGQAIHLEGFKEHEAQPLLYGLTEKVGNPQIVLREVLAWTNGQPFLTQKLCRLIRNESAVIPNQTEADWIEQLVQTYVLENWETQDEPEHLKTIRDRILKTEHDPRNLLNLYQQILQQSDFRAANHPDIEELLLSGLVIQQQDILQVRNRIYERIFNADWVQKALNHCI
jgi:PAS domain S-box-containing protein